MAKRLQIVFILVCSFIAGFTQSSYQVINYSSRQGLSNSSVYDVLKDSKGFLWIATEAGLNKFDGKNFYSYTVFSNDLPDNSIVGLVEIGGGKLFCSTGSSGFFVFDPATEKVVWESRFKSFIYKSHTIVYANGQIYAGINQNNTILVFDDKKFEIRDTIKLKDTVITDFSVTPPGEILLITNKGLVSRNKGNRISEIPHKTSSVMRRLSAFSQGSIHSYAAVGNYFYVLEKNTGKVLDSVKYADSDVIIKEVIEDKSKVWFCSHYPCGVYMYDLKKRKLTAFASHFKGINNTIASIVQDNEKNIWVGTYSSGLYKISPSLFETPATLKEENIYNVGVVSESEYLVCTRAGMAILNREKMPDTLNTFFNQSHVYNVIQAGNKTVVTSSGVAKVETLAGKKFFFLHKRGVYALNDTLIIAGNWSNDVDIIQLQKDTFKVVKTRKLSTEQSDRVNCFLPVSGFIWCGTDKGLYILDKELNLCYKVRGSVFEQGIVDMVESHGAVYIATRIGLAQYYEGKLTFTKEINNHSIDRITSLCKDRSGNVYMSTLNGLFRLRGNGYNNYFDVEEGLSSGEINRVVYNPYANALCIATNEGLNELNLFQFTYLEKSIPRIHFDKLTSNGSVSEEDGVYNLKSRNVNLYFGSICYTHTSSITYKWKIDDGAYHYIINPSIEFAALSYGRHEIEIYASNDGSSWSAPCHIRLNIITPYYFTWWFYAVSGTALIAVIVFVFRRRLSKIRREAELKAELEQKITNLKNEALNASINPHFVFNALNSVQHYINTNRNDEASDYLARLAYLIRQTLENASAHHITIHEEITRLKLYLELEKLRFNNGFAYEISIDSEINTYKVTVPNMILQPLIENAIIHGFKQIEYLGYIKLHIMKRHDELIICIDDNGRGMIKTENLFVSDKEKKSIALSNVKERIKTIPGAYLKITDKSFLQEKDRGVRVEIRLPL